MVYSARSFCSGPKGLSFQVLPPSNDLNEVSPTWAGSPPPSLNSSARASHTSQPSSGERRFRAGELDRILPLPQPLGGKFEPAVGDDALVDPPVVVLDGVPVDGDHQGTFLRPFARRAGNRPPARRAPRTKPSRRAGRQGKGSSSPDSYPRRRPNPRPFRCSLSRGRRSR